MTQITIDPALVHRLKSAHSPVELCDPTGTVLGEFLPRQGRLPAGFQCPFSDEEIEQARRDPVTLPTDEAIRRLRAR